MIKRSSAPFLLLLAMYSPAQGQGGEPATIGRLFSPAGAPAAKTGAPLVAETQLRVDGVVIRSSRKDTVWINGRAVTDGSSHSSARLLPNVMLEGKHRLKVGETFDLDKGARSDMIQGEITSSGSKP